MTSILSNEVATITGPVPAQNPPVINSVLCPKNVATVNITLPAADADGNPLAELSQVEVFYDTTDMAGKTVEDLKAAGVKSVVLPVTLEQAGQVVEVTVPGLAYATQFFFESAVS